MYCRQCGKEVKESAKFCAYCGTDQGLAQPVQSVQTMQPSNASLGSDIATNQETQINRPQKNKKSKAKVILTIVIVAILVIAGYLLVQKFFFGNSIDVLSVIGSDGNTVFHSDKSEDDFAVGPVVELGEYTYLYTDLRESEVRRRGGIYRIHKDGSSVEEVFSQVDYGYGRSYLSLFRWDNTIWIMETYAQRENEDLVSIFYLYKLNPKTLEMEKVTLDEDHIGFLPIYVDDFEYDEETLCGLNMIGVNKETIICHVGVHLKSMNDYHHRLIGINPNDGSVKILDEEFYNQFDDVTTYDCISNVYGMYNGNLYYSKGRYFTKNEKYNILYNTLDPTFENSNEKILDVFDDKRFLPTRVFPGISGGKIFITSVLISENKDYDMFSSVDLSTKTMSDYVLSDEAGKLGSVFYKTLFYGNKIFYTNVLSSREERGQIIWSCDEDGENINEIVNIANMPGGYGMLLGVSDGYIYYYLVHDQESIYMYRINYIRENSEPELLIDLSMENFD